MKRYDIPVVWQESGIISVFAEDEASAINIALHKAMSSKTGALNNRFVSGSMHIDGSPVLSKSEPDLSVSLSIPTDTYALLVGAETWDPDVDDIADALPPGEHYVFTAMFEDQQSMDIAVEGTESGRPMVTAILYDATGREVYRQNENAFAGLHAIEYNGLSYSTFVSANYN